MWSRYWGHCLEEQQRHARMCSYSKGRPLQASRCNGSTKDPITTLHTSPMITWSVLVWMSDRSPSGVTDTQPFLTAQPSPPTDSSLRTKDTAQVQNWKFPLSSWTQLHKCAPAAKAVASCCIRYNLRSVATLS